jgi:hypothetical protein
VAEAQAALADEGLTSVVITKPDGDGATCEADDTVPDYGTRVKKDETVQLVVTCYGPIGSPGKWDGEPIARVSANDADALARLTRLTNTAEELPHAADGARQAIDSLTASLPAS